VEKKEKGGLVPEGGGKQSSGMSSRQNLTSLKRARITEETRGKSGLRKGAEERLRGGHLNVNWQAQTPMPSGYPRCRQTIYLVPEIALHRRLCDAARSGSLGNNDDRGRTDDGGGLPHPNYVSVNAPPGSLRLKVRQEPYHFNRV